MNTKKINFNFFTWSQNSNDNNVYENNIIIGSNDVIQFKVKQYKIGFELMMRKVQKKSFDEYINKKNKFFNERWYCVSVKTRSDVVDIMELFLSESYHDLSMFDIEYPDWYEYLTNDKWSELLTD